ncbi:MAG: hypothetical protein IH921_07900 [Gemmatimonadetes bacterium]|nr:hypothetical protein [Gemmatimonadota bacterium]
MATLPAPPDVAARLVANNVKFNDRARILDAAKSRGLKTNGNQVHVGGSRITLR